MHIARVPDKTKAFFISLAEAEFCGDYGMTLKWLIDDIPSQDTRLLIAKIEDFEARIHALESGTNKIEKNPPQEFRTMSDGSKRVIRGLSKK